MLLLAGQATGALTPTASSALVTSASGLAPVLPQAAAPVDKVGNDEDSSWGRASLMSMQESDDAVRPDTNPWGYMKRATINMRKLTCG
jgi:hypothetical protein